MSKTIKEGVGTSLGDFTEWKCRNWLRPAAWEGWGVEPGERGGKHKGGRKRGGPRGRRAGYGKVVRAEQVNETRAVVRHGVAGRHLCQKVESVGGGRRTSGDGSAGDTAPHPGVLMWKRGLRGMWENHGNPVPGRRGNGAVWTSVDVVGGVLDIGLVAGAASGRRAAGRTAGHRHWPAQHGRSMGIG